jgi:uncharacterized protein (TIGR04255 family)
MGIPIGEKNAIDSASFIVVFDRPFESNVIESLHGLKQLLKDDYPHFESTKAMEVRFEGGEVRQQIGVASGCVLQNFRLDGRPSWVLRVEGNAIAVSCMDYGRWSEVSSKAIVHIAKILSLVNHDTNSVASFVLQVIDRFVPANEESYSLGQVFNAESRYLTKQVADAGELWHVYQGWFEEKPDLFGQLLHALNLSTNRTETGVSTTIDHATHLQFQPSKVVSDLNEAFILRTFDALHEGNKFIIKGLLADEQLKRINLQ